MRHFCPRHCHQGALLSPPEQKNCMALRLSLRKNDQARPAMIRSIVGSSLKFRYIVLALAAIMMVFGIAQIPRMPVDAFPEFAPPRVEIQTPCLGLSAEEV